MSTIVRTVKHGRVSIDGRQYQPPDHYVVYDGRLEKTRLVFGVYSYRTDIVHMWGTLYAYDNAICQEDDVTCVDGKFPWMYWEVVREDKP